MSEVMMEGPQLILGVKCKISVNGFSPVHQKLVFHTQCIAPWHQSNITALYVNVQIVVYHVFHGQ